jgi:hypothetical protein
MRLTNKLTELKFFDGTSDAGMFANPDTIIFSSGVATALITPTILTSGNLLLKAKGDGAGGRQVTGTSGFIPVIND